MLEWAPLVVDTRGVYRKSTACYERWAPVHLTSNVNMDPTQAEVDNEELVGRVARLEADVAKLELVTKGILETFAWVALAAPVAVLAIRLGRPRGMLWPHVYDAVHITCSALLALIALRLSRRVLAGVFQHPMWHYLIAAAVVTGVGGGIEVLQLVGPGHASVGDVIRDSLGGLSALLFALSIDRDRGQDVAASALRRWGLRAAAAVVFCLAFSSTARAIGAFALRYERFPTLANFEPPWERDFIEAGGGAVLTVQPPPNVFTRAHGKAVAKVVFAKGKGTYGGLELSRLVGNWSSYGALIFEVYSAETSPVSLELRVHDRHHRSKYSDRFNTSLVVPPGQTTVSIPIESIRNGPTGRQMDMAGIRGIILFLVSPAKPVTLYFDDFRLE